jgi:hypothetical protein
MAGEVYLGNPLLKAANVQLEYDEHSISEYLKCKDDPIHFCNNYVKIVHVDHGLINFDMYDYQKDMIDKFHNNRFVICKMPRQTGKTTTIISYLLHYAIFNETINIAILANKGSTARDILQRLQTAYEHLPKWLQQGVLVWNKGSIQLENGSKIIASSTSSSAVRGSSFNIIFLDEFAHIDPPSLADQFFTSVYPTISSGKTTKVFIVSTPKGLNMFYKMWNDAEEGRNNYIPIETHWSQVPGRDQKWRDETVRNTSDVQFAQEYECEFIGSQHTLISAVKLRQLSYKTPFIKKDTLEIYEDVQPTHSYVSIVDVARGRGLDYSAISVIDVTTYPHIQVAKYRDPNISPMVLPGVVENISKHFNNAYVLVETNDIGGQVADILHYDLEYENIFHATINGRAGQQLGGGFGGGTQIGVRTTKEVKRKGCSNLKDLIESDKLIIHDLDTISELTTFVAHGQTYQAEEGCHDDLVMTLVLFGWMIEQRYYKEITDMDLREKLHAEQLAEMEESVIPFGFIQDGFDEEATYMKMGNDQWIINKDFVVHDLP